MRTVGSGINLDRIRLWTVLRQTPAPRSKSDHDLPPRLSGDRQRRGLHRHREPRYLNYYRRTVAHNSVLVYDPAEKFFWSDNLLPAANDGGQRMDSSRYWNTIRSREDWNRTRDLWDLGTMRVVDYVPGQYHYALGDASNAYSRTSSGVSRANSYTCRGTTSSLFLIGWSAEPVLSKGLAASRREPASVDQDGEKERQAPRSSATPTLSLCGGIGRIAGAFASSPGAPRHPARR